MLRLAVFLLLIIHASVTFGNQYQEIKDLSGNALLLANKVAKATFGFKTNLNCTGFYIGTHGEALTALHCVEKCLLDTPGTTEVRKAYAHPVFIDPGNSDNKYFISKFSVKIDQQHPVNCKSKFFFNSAETEGSLEILKVYGPGFLGPKNLLPELTAKDIGARNNLLQQGFEAAGDLVLIRVPILKGSVCLPAGLTDFTKDAPDVFNLAYTAVLRPSKSTTAPLNVIGDWKQAIASSGKASSNRSLFFALDDLTFKSIVPPGTMLSSIDAEAGSSGSPLVNNDGEFVGVVRAGYNFSTQRYSEWTTQAIDISSRLTEILTSLEELVCQKHSP